MTIEDNTTPAVDENAVPAAEAAPTDTLVEAPEGTPSEPAPKPERPGKGYVPQHVVQKRIDQLTRQKYELQQQVDNLRKEIADTGTPGVYTQADVEMAARRLVEQEKFNDRCEAIYNSGTSKFDDFDAALRNLGALGGLPNEVISVVSEFPNADAVLYELGHDLEKADKIFSLPVHKQAVELAKLAMTLDKPEPKPELKPVSKAPAPISPIGGSAKSSLPSDKMSMSEWVAAREAQMRAKHNG